MNVFTVSSSTSHPRVEVHTAAWRSALTSPSEDAATKGVEDELFVHYLDQVFYTQYPFYRSRARHSRAWLYSILRAHPATYFGTLALSEHELLAMRPSKDDDFTANLSQLRTKESYHGRAVHEMYRFVGGLYSWSEDQQESNILIGLVSLLQLVSCEVRRELYPELRIVNGLLANMVNFQLFSGCTGNWKDLIRSANCLIPKLIQIRLSRGSKDSSVSAATGGNSSENGPANFLLGCFIALDVLSSVSTRWTPMLEINHAEVLDTLDINLEGVLGCRNSVIQLILEISLLDRWKKDSQAARKLSILGLAKRSERIEARLVQELTDLDKESATVGQDQNLDSSGTAAVTEISRIFALSAITYLHVVVSGAHPELSEISST